MKRFLYVLLALAMLCGCAAPQQSDRPTATETTLTEVDPMKQDMTASFVTAPGAQLPADKTVSLQGNDIPDLDTGDLVLLTLEVKADSGVKKLGIQFYQSGVEAADTYYIPSQWTRIVLCSDPAATPVGLKLTAEPGIALRSLTLTNKKKATPESLESTLGQFLVDDQQRITLPETDAVF